MLSEAFSTPSCPGTRMRKLPRRRSKVSAFEIVNLELTCDFPEEFDGGHALSDSQVRVGRSPVAPPPSR
jgi:hypothetical protein